MKITVNITCGENRNTRGANLTKTIITMQTDDLPKLFYSLNSNILYYGYQILQNVWCKGR